MRRVAAPRRICLPGGRAFPSRRPGEAPSTYKSILEVAPRGRFWADGPGRPHQRTNLYRKWPLESLLGRRPGEPGGPCGLAGRPEAISDQVAQESPVDVKFVLEIAFGEPFQARGPPGGPYGLAGPRRPFPTRWPRAAPLSIAKHSYA